MRSHKTVLWHSLSLYAVFWGVHWTTSKDMLSFPAISMTCWCHSHCSNMKKRKQLCRWMVQCFNKSPIFLGLSENIPHSGQIWKQKLNANLKHYCLCVWKCDSERCKILKKLGACSVWSLMMMYIQMSPVSCFAADALSRNVLFHNIYPVIPYCQPKNQNSQQPTCLQLFYLLSSFQEAVIYCQYKSH